MSDMDHLLTPAQKRAATKEKKQKAMRKNLGIEKAPAKKVKRKRKPMSEEQRAAAVERLAKARAARGPAKTPAAHPRVLELEDDHPLSLVNSKSTLKEWKDKLKSIRSQKDSKDTKQRGEYQLTENYVKNIAAWIRDGVWLDHKYGIKHDQIMEYIVYAPASYPDGTIKRSVGFYYPDIGQVWTKELEKEYN